MLSMVVAISVLRVPISSECVLSFMRFSPLLGGFGDKNARARHPMRPLREKFALVPNCCQSAARH
jgi:hypothetical protein